LTTAPGSIAWNGSSQGGSAGGVTITEWDTYANQYDVMYAVKNGQSVNNSSAGTIPLAFQHALAVVGFTAKSSTDADVYSLKGMSFNDLQFKGTLVLDNTVTELTPSWEILDTGDKDLTLTAAVFSVPGPGATGSAIKLTDHLLVIPQASRSVTLTYRVKNSLTDLTVILPLPRVIWKAGHRYIYNLVFTPSEIKATVTVTDWVGTPVDETIEIS
ncbi:MAG: fimbrillin family protein, partial [Bacteroidales bacterium]|nr:fimbrillin family protein [Bacteroidales bacterium]